MTKIVVTYTVTCDDEKTAQQVQSEYFPNMDDMLGLPGITSVSSTWATWTAQREQVSFSTVHPQGSTPWTDADTTQPH